MSATSTALLRACSLLLCLVAGSRQLSIKEFVVPKAVEIGNDAELRCQYELGAGETEAALFVKWWWTPESSSSDDRKQIYQRIAGQPAESIHHDNSSKIEIKENDTIVLTDVSPVDSGRYECEVWNIEEVRQHDKLIVFHMGTGPTVNVSEVEVGEDDRKDNLLLVECQADDVAPKPELSVTINGHEINMTTIIEDVDSNGLYSVYANTTLSTDDMEESEVRCEIFYSDTNIAHPPYVDVKTFVPAGDDGVQLHCSWVLLTIAVLLTHLQDTL
ncbi:uncharacterized protein LOC142975666 isoform X2 [Anticarsia gemmatalis]|uniref:uncharacterized protein LOC142975666 isoform X2 n=1 Tax=Anticarsia gemmatalis TaxID=129554 RepID=UPI003F76C53E